MQFDISNRFELRASNSKRLPLDKWVSVPRRTLRFLTMTCNVVVGDGIQHGRSKGSTYCACRNASPVAVDKRSELHEHDQECERLGLSQTWDWRNNSMFWDMRRRFWSFSAASVSTDSLSCRHYEKHDISSHKYHSHMSIHELLSHFPLSF